MPVGKRQLMWIFLAGAALACLALVAAWPGTAGDGGAIGGAYAASVSRADAVLGVPVAVGGAREPGLTEDETKLVQLINKERIRAGLAPLQVDKLLTVLARLKAEDMADKGYLAHYSLVYGSMEDMLRKAKVHYRETGENLARAGTVESAHVYFMKNFVTRNRILDPAFDQVGVAVVPVHGYLYVVEWLVKGSVPKEDGPNEGVGGQRSGSTGSDRPGRDGASEPAPAPGSGDMTADEREMFNLVNRERVQRGLPALQFDAALARLARLKAGDMVENNYFGHTSPTYGSPFDMMRKAGIRYVYAGENLAMAPTAASAHTALMDSRGHRANILNADFDRLGIGVVEKGRYKYFVQMFTGDGKAAPHRPAPEPQPEPSPQPQPSPQPGPTAGSMTAEEKQMLDLVNRERLRRGTNPLQANPALVQLARLKARDMIQNNYFSHTSPTYGSPFDMMRQFGIRYSWAGENLAGAPSVEVAHTSLMNSTGHRRNILNEHFTQVGIGIVDGGPYGKMFVQMFIRP